MKYFSRCHWAIVLFGTLFLAGACSPKDEDLAPAPATAKPADVQAVAKLEAPTATTTPGPARTVAAVPTVDFSAGTRPLNEQGNPLSDLEYLNHLVHEVNEARAAGPEVKQAQFKTEAEQAAYEAAQRQRLAPVKELNELVTAKVIKALPVPPAGQRYAIDAASGKVILQ